MALGVTCAYLVQGGATKAVDTANQQVVELTAKNGYSPSVLTAKAGLPVLLKVKTQDTQDCSVEFTIPSFGIKATLPVTGEKDFALPAQKAGETIDGSCQMGMSKFKIEFK